MPEANQGSSISAHVTAVYVIYRDSQRKQPTSGINKQYSSAYTNSKVFFWIDRTLFFPLSLSLSFTKKKRCALTEEKQNSHNTPCACCLYYPGFDKQPLHAPDRIGYQKLNPYQNHQSEKQYHRFAFSHPTIIPAVHQTMACIFSQTLCPPGYTPTTSRPPGSAHQPAHRPAPGRERSAVMPTH